MCFVQRPFHRSLLTTYLLRPKSFQLSHRIYLITKCRGAHSSILNCFQSKSRPFSLSSLVYFLTHDLSYQNITPGFEAFPHALATTKPFQGSFELGTSLLMP